jgi:hypothetical protein
MGQDIEQSYYKYVLDYINVEAEDNFVNSIDESDHNFLYNYSCSVMDRICESTRGFEVNPELKNYVFNEIMLGTQVGFLLNSANKRFSLESTGNNNFIEYKKTLISKKTLKEKIVAFLLKQLGK